MLEQKPLALDDYRDIRSLGQEQFLRADDLSVRFQSDSPVLVDGSHGLLAWFPWWDRAEAERWARSEQRAPLGSLDDPFHEEEQGWRVLIWRVDEAVYVMAGDEEFFRVRFTVPVERYLSAWAALVGS